MARVVQHPSATAWTSDALLLTAAVVTAETSYSTTARYFNLLAVGVGAVAVVVALARGGGLGAPRASNLILALVIGLSPQLTSPPQGNISKTAFYPVGLTLGLAAVGLAILAVARGHERLAGLAVVVLGAAALCTVAGGRRPQIDVWIIFQQAAAGLFHGLNPYDTTFSGVPAGQTADCFNYLPATLLPTWLGWITFDDVRWGEVAVMLGGWAALVWVVRRRPGRQPALILIAVAATMAGTLRVAQQAWNESILLGLLLIAVALLVAGRRGWAILALALALATKQHAALLLPLLAIWPAVGWRRTVASVAGAAALSAPWIVWNLSRFKECTVDFFLNIKPRFDSISLWQFVPGPLQTVAVLVALLVAYAVVLRWVPRTPAGLLVGSGVVLFGFDLFNKQTFENQWWLVCELIVCGIALRTTELPAEVRQADAVAR